MNGAGLEMGRGRDGGAGGLGRACGQANAFANIWCARVYDFCFIFWSLAHMSSHLFFFPQLNVVGLLNSAHECNRPSLLDFLFSDPPLPAAIVVIIVIVVVVVFIKDPTYHLVCKLRQNPASRA